MFSLVTFYVDTFTFSDNTDYSIINESLLSMIFFFAYETMNGTVTLNKLLGPVTIVTFCPIFPNTIVIFLLLSLTTDTVQPSAYLANDKTFFAWSISKFQMFDNVV